MCRQQTWGIKFWELSLCLLASLIVAGSVAVAPVERPAAAPIDAPFGIVESYVNSTAAMNLAWPLVNWMYQMTLFVIPV
ncbi:MAG: hypothetical protein KJ063_25835 [Anaerolineae bacterium]|nr:hypothetical protein [Anaerolineae bacterium]